MNRYKLLLVNAVTFSDIDNAVLDIDDHFVFLLVSVVGGSCVNVCKLNVHVTVLFTFIHFTNLFTLRSHKPVFAKGRL